MGWDGGVVQVQVHVQVQIEIQVAQPAAAKKKKKQTKLNEISAKYNLQFMNLFWTNYARMMNTLHYTTHYATLHYNLVNCYYFHIII